MTSYLLDTHVLLWLAHRPHKLSVRVRDALSDGDNHVLVSPVSAFEISTKSRMGKLEFETDLAHEFVRLTGAHGLDELPISAAHAQQAGTFGYTHKDPWDRLLAAQSLVERIPLVTIDPFFSTIGITTFW